MFTGKEQMRTMNIIQSDRHEVYSVEVNKVALSSKDDKRHVLEDKIHTLAHEFYKCIVNGPEPRFSNYYQYYPTADTPNETVLHPS